MCHTFNAPFSVLQEEFFCSGIKRSLDINFLARVLYWDGVHGHCENECKQEGLLSGRPGWQLH